MVGKNGKLNDTIEASALWSTCTDLLQWSVPGGAGAPTHRYQYQGGLVHLPIGTSTRGGWCTYPSVPVPGGAGAPTHRYQYQGGLAHLPIGTSTRGGWCTYPSVPVPGGAGAPTHRQCAATLHCLTTASPPRS